MNNKWRIKLKSVIFPPSFSIFRVAQGRRIELSLCSSREHGAGSWSSVDVSTAPVGKMNNWTIWTMNCNTSHQFMQIPRDLGTTHTQQRTAALQSVFNAYPGSRLGGRDLEDLQARESPPACRFVNWEFLVFSWTEMAFGCTDSDHNWHNDWRLLIKS